MDDRVGRLMDGEMGECGWVTGWMNGWIVESVVNGWMSEYMREWLWLIFHTLKQMILNGSFSSQEWTLF